MPIRPFELSHTVATVEVAVAVAAAAAAVFQWPQLYVVVVVVVSIAYPFHHNFAVFCFALLYFSSFSCMFLIWFSPPPRKLRKTKKKKRKTNEMKWKDVLQTICLLADLKTHVYYYYDEIFVRVARFCISWSHCLAFYLIASKSCNRQNGE